MGCLSSKKKKKKKELLIKPSRPRLISEIDEYITFKIVLLGEAMVGKTCII